MLIYTATTHTHTGEDPGSKQALFNNKANASIAAEDTIKNYNQLLAHTVCQSL